MTEHKELVSFGVKIEARLCVGTEDKDEISKKIDEFVNYLKNTNCSYISLKKTEVL